MRAVETKLSTFISLRSIGTRTYEQRQTHVLNVHRKSYTLNLEMKILKSISHDAQTTNVNAIIIVLDQSKTKKKNAKLVRCSRI